MTHNNRSGPGRRSVSISNTRVFRSVAAFLFLSSVAVSTICAQSVRGTVVDAANRAPIDETFVVLVSANGKDTVSNAVRTNAAGQFVLYARDPGPYRVSAMRIGFKPVVGEPIALKDEEVAMMEVAMSSVPTTLSTVEVRERRALTASELMSPVGFDLRTTRKIGQFITRDELTKYGRAPLDDVIRNNAQRLSLDFASDNFLNDVIIMRSGVNYCLPEIRLDGNLVANTSGAAASRLRTYGANQIYGVEVYRALQLPPPRLAGELGITAQRCGAVAIWTRNYGVQTTELMFRNFPGGN